MIESRNTMFWRYQVGKPKEYLAVAVKARIENGGIQMKVQIQVAGEAEAENLAFFHPEAAWPRKEWLHLGTISLSSLAGDDYMRESKTTPRNSPAEMSLIPAVSPKDPNWTQVSRIMTYDATAAVREILTSTNTMEAQAKTKAGRELLGDASTDGSQDRF